MTGRVFTRTIVGFGFNYVVSNNGEVYSISRKGNWNTKKLKPQVNHNGYHKVTLTKNNKRTYKFVHRLVAEAYIDNPENKRTVNHIDGVKTNNNLLNLEWATHSENSQHAVDNNLGIRAKGQDMSKKLTEQDVVQIMEMRARGCTYKSIAINFNVSSGCIRGILIGRRWNHFTNIKPL